MLIGVIIAYVLIAWATLVILKINKWQRRDDEDRAAAATVWPILLIYLIGIVIYRVAIVSANKAIKLIEALFDKDKDEEEENE